MKDLSQFYRREFLGFAGKGILAAGILNQVQFDCFAITHESSAEHSIDRIPIETPSMKPLKDSIEQLGSPSEEK